MQNRKKGTYAACPGWHTFAPLAQRARTKLNASLDENGLRR
jgi:hypothetical protein